jgi:phage baseplate assembly protein W
MHINYPFRIDKNGRTSTITNEEDHVRQLIRQVLFTAPGERVNRPDFGSGVNQLVFAPNSDELATATQLLVQGSLQQWLGNMIKVESIETRSEESELHVSIQYTTLRDQHRHNQTFGMEI